MGYALLCVLHKGPLTGYEILQRMRKPVGYYWTAPQSQIYPALARLTEQGLIDHDEEPGPGPRPRKTHRLTPAGRDALSAWLTQPAEPPAPRDETILKTYAQLAADPGGMSTFYQGEIVRLRNQLADYQAQRDALIGTGAEEPDHPAFGAYATLTLGCRSLPVRIEWCEWLVAQMAHRRPRPD
nr:PadR family transcriptional regulator [Streptomyces sp. SID13031]